jgi:hypothetical protein
MLWLTNRMHRAAVVRGVVLHLAEALLLEGGVAHGQHLVDDEDLRLEVRRHGEGQPHVHAAGVALHRRVEERSTSAKATISSKLARRLALAHAEDGAVEEDVLAAAQLRVEAGADLQQARRRGRGAAPRPRVGGDAREDLQQRALAGAVAADEAQHFAVGGTGAEPERRGEAR